ncbi:DUF92 domain-containing protein [Falsibacillus albus]|uniref:DUF92 domain-containing protein n=1 Tax=Falsibacillus albus TaxID=2478915 RepID=A0A3L7K7F2_9BACI|nr:DUF92 domain-containing protein [Falsibacillus albus]RLQ98229.1 DUF92 domain-containing protein [Falsibacillus albus]
MHNMLYEIPFILMICAAGVWTRSLSVSGGIAAFLSGGMIAAAFEWRGLFVLGVFFLSSSLLSKYKKQEKKKVEEIVAKGDRRDWQQVAANGGPAALFSFIYLIQNGSIWQLCFCASIAAANADTWSSELGVLSKGKPFSIRTFSTVEKGTSGAVSFMGTLAGLMGAICIALAAMFLFSSLEVRQMLFIAAAGFAGNIIDTLLGASLQVEFYCKKCGIKTERKTHCGSRTEKIKGIPFINNETVNFISPFFAGLLIFVLFQ